MSRLALSLLAGCALLATSAAGQVTPSSDSFPPFVVRAVYDAGAPVYAMCEAELDSTAAGPEIVALSGAGTVLLLRYAAGAWTATPIATDLGEFSFMASRPTLSVADVHAGFAGPEVVVNVGQNVYALHRDSDGQWDASFVFDGRELFGISWGARAGDLDPAAPGDEVFHVWEGVADLSTGTLYRQEGGAFVGETIYGLDPYGEVVMDSAIGDFDATSPGAELALTTEMGPTYALLSPPAPGEPWTRRLLWNDFENAGWVVRIADVDPTRPGVELVYGTRYLNRMLVSYPVAGGAHELEVIYDGGPVDWPPAIYDIATGGVLPDTPGAQVVGVDFQGEATLVAYQDGAWRGAVIWRDESGPLYAAAAGRWLAGCPDAQIAVAGESGVIRLLTAAIPGDLNADGAVDLTDLATLLANLGLGGGATYEQGDVDRDGAIDLEDLGLLLARFGAACE